MGRDTRPLGENSSYHVTTRGNDKMPLFYDDQDRNVFINHLDRVACACGWIGWAYCLMTNHIHLCVTTPSRNLSDGMRDTLGQYSRYLNRKYDRTGHRFRNRFGSVVVTSDHQLHAVIRYVARNPVRAGLVATAERWPWSSYAGLVGDGPLPRFIDGDRVLSLYHRRPTHARAALATAVALSEPGARELTGRCLPSVSALLIALPAADAVRAARTFGYARRDVQLVTGWSRTVMDRWWAQATEAGDGITAGRPRAGRSQR